MFGSLDPQTILPIVRRHTLSQLISHHNPVRPIELQIWQIYQRYVGWEKCQTNHIKISIILFSTASIKSSKTSAYLATFFASQFFLNLLSIYFYHKLTITRWAFDKFWADTNEAKWYSRWWALQRTSLRKFTIRENTFHNMLGVSNHLKHRYWFHS